MGMGFKVSVSVIALAIVSIGGVSAYAGLNINPYPTKAQKTAPQIPQTKTPPQAKQAPQTNKTQQIVKTQGSTQLKKTATTEPVNIQTKTPHAPISVQTKIKPAVQAKLAAPKIPLVDQEALKKQIESDVRRDLEAKMRAQVDAQVNAQVQNKVQAQLDEALKREQAINEQKLMTERAQIKAALEADLQTKVNAQVEDKVQTQLNAALTAQTTRQNAALEKAIAREQALNAQKLAAEKAQIKADLEAQLQAKLDDQVNSKVQAQLEAALEAQNLAQKANIEEAIKHEQTLNAEKLATERVQIKAALEADLEEKLNTQVQQSVKTQVKAALDEQTSRQNAAAEIARQNKVLEIEKQAALRAEIKAQIESELQAEMAALKAAKQAEEQKKIAAAKAVKAAEDAKASAAVKLSANKGAPTRKVAAKNAPIDLIKTVKANDTKNVPVTPPLSVASTAPTLNVVSPTPEQIASGGIVYRPIAIGQAPMDGAKTTADKQAAPKMTASVLTPDAPTIAAKTDTDDGENAPLFVGLNGQAPKSSAQESNVQKSNTQSGVETLKTASVNVSKTVKRAFTPIGNYFKDLSKPPAGMIDNAPQTPKNTPAPAVMAKNHTANAMPSMVPTPKSTMSETAKIMESIRPAAGDAKLDTKAPKTSMRAAPPKTLQDRGLVAIKIDAPKDAPTANVAPAPTWSVTQGQDLRAALGGWSAQADVHMIWGMKKGFIIPQTAAINGTYEQAVQALLELYALDNDRPMGSLHIDPKTNQKTLVIQQQG